jgi:membrane-bound serine protease (ClpP class)
MSLLLQAYIVCFAAGLILIGAEIFVPGGILGLIGGLALAAAAVIGLNIFPAPWNLFNVFGIIVISIGLLLLWLKYFPRTPVGRGVTLSQNASGFKSESELKIEPGTRCVTATALHPSGMALLDGRRIDVMAEGGYVEAHQTVEVVRMQGNYVIVRPCETETGAPA